MRSDFFRGPRFHGQDARAAWWLLAPLLLVAATAPAVTLQSVIDGTAGNVVTLSSGTSYTGAATINRDLTINGNGATLTLNKAAFERINVPSGFTLTVNNLQVQGGFSVAKFATSSSGILNGITATGQNTAIEHEGTGSLTVTNSSFANLDERALLLFGPSNSAATSLTFNNVTITNAPFGLLLIGGATLNFTNGTFTSVNRPFNATDAVLGSSGNRARIESVTLTGAAAGGDTGFALGSSTFTDLVGVTINKFRYPVQLPGNSDAFLQNVTIDDKGISNPSVAVSIRNGSKVRAEDCVFIGHMNSLDATTNSTIEAERCTFIHPHFSGIICIQNSVANVRNSFFIDNGQDSLFYGKETLAGGEQPDTSRGTIENNVSINAGVDNVAGTGIALLGTGPFTVTNNVVTGSFDVGIVTKNRTTATIRRNMVAANKKSGIVLNGAQNVTLRENSIVGHSVASQAGLIVEGNSTTVNVYSNLVAGNDFGVIYRDGAATSSFIRNFFTQNAKQGISVTSGRVTSTYSSFLDNSDWQAHVGSSQVSIFQDSAFRAPNKRGVYTERGSCSGSPSNLTNATANWWNAASGPQNRCSGASPDARMEYQNANVSGFKTSANMEAYYSGDSVRGTSPTTLSSGASPWLTVTLPARTKAHSVLGAMRIVPVIPGSSPPNALDTRAVFLWVTPNLTELAGIVSLTFRTQPLASQPLLARYDSQTGTFDAALGANWSPAAPDLVTVIASPSFLANGTWFFMPADTLIDNNVLDALLGQRDGTGLDANSDTRVDAADLRPEL